MRITKSINTMFLSRPREVTFAGLEAFCLDNDSMNRGLIDRYPGQSWLRKDTPVGFSVHHSRPSGNRLSVDLTSHPGSNLRPVLVSEIFPASTSHISAPAARRPFPRFSVGPMVESSHQRIKFSDGQIKVSSHSSLPKAIANRGFVETEPS